MRELTVKSNPPIQGHALLAEGGVTRTYDELDHVVLDGGCECGAQPPDWPDTSKNGTKRWHREHKAKLRSGGAS